MITIVKTSIYLGSEFFCKYFTNNSNEDSSKPVKSYNHAKF